MPNVVIVQEYIPHYREPFFMVMHQEAAKVGIDVKVVSGTPGLLGKRNDSVDLSFGVTLPQREYRLAGRRLTFRRISAVTADADLVVLEQARRNADAYRALARSRCNRPMIALWGHGRDYTRKATRLDRAAQRWLTQRADWFFAYTRGGAETVTGDGFRHDRVTVVQNATDTATLKRELADVGDAEVEAFGASYDLRGKTALFMGALDESKRLYFLRDAVSNAYRLDSDVRLLIGGDGPLRTEVAAWERQLDWLSYLGPVRGRDRALAGKAAQVLAMPGRVGLVAVDSFALKTPIVTTNWPWHAPEFEYLENGRNAVIAQDSIEAYAPSLLETLRDKQVIAHMSRSCALDSEIYTIEAMAGNFLKGIIRALEAGPR